MLPACEQALADDSYNADAAEARAIARALTGNLAGAAEDLQSYITANENSAYPWISEGLPQRRAWLATLRRGENPFTEAVLEELG